MHKKFNKSERHTEIDLLILELRNDTYSRELINKAIHRIYSSAAINFKISLTPKELVFILKNVNPKRDVPIL